MEDVCQANYLVGLYKDKLKGDVYNVAHNSNTTLNELLDIIKTLSSNKDLPIDKKDNFRVGDVFKTHADIDKIKKLNFIPKTHIKEGVELTYSWYKTILKKYKNG